MNHIFIACAVIAIFSTARGAPPPNQPIDLSGKWHVRLDRANEGEARGWAAKPLDDARAARLPGSLATNGIGDDITLQTPWMGDTGRGGFTSNPRYAPYRQPGNIKLPFWLQPDKYYMGKAWYQREITIPSTWQGKRINLLLERCHWGSTAWIDGRKIGTAESLGTPHNHDLGTLAPGPHLLTLCIDNSYLIRVGPDASSITDHTQTNWNGIIGRIELSARDDLHIDSQCIYPSNDGTIKVKLDLHNAGKQAVDTTIRIDITGQKSGAPAGTATKTVNIPAGGTTASIDLKLDHAPMLWSEFTPNLYVATTSVSTGSSRDTAANTFGFREIRADGHKLLVNGVPIFLRGNLDCAAFPLTGHPSMDVAEWTRIFRVYKAYGLNHARFHSWCPPEAAFTAADQLGMYLQPEGGVWRGTCPYKNAKPVEPFLYEEAERIFRAYGNHPSFVIYTHGNEPWELDQKKLNDEWVPAMKKIDPRHLVAAGSNYPLGDNNDVHIPGGGFGVRYHGAFHTAPATTRNYEGFVATKAAPCITHEPGEWCVFPNLNEIAKYTGVLKARNFEIVRDFMESNHLLGQADDFLMASGKFQTLVYKEETEAFLRTRGLAGFQMLGLNDFPGQGTALVGVVDAFWDAKPYVTAAGYKRFSGPVVPLAIMAKRVWLANEAFTAKIRIAQYSGAPLDDATPVWRITGSQGRDLASGKLTASTIPVGNATDLGEVTFPLAAITTAGKLTLHVSLPGTEYQNSWDFWVYPATSAGPQGKVKICTTLGEATAELARGANVLLLPKPNQVTGKTSGTFQPIFWNKAWFPGQKEHTLGLLVQNKHPALAGFPTDSHADWQWWDLMNHSKPAVLDALPPELLPIIQPIDDWNTCRRLGTLFEARSGPGKLVVCTMDLVNDMENRPVARQLRASLLAYMNSSGFAPKVELGDSQLATVIAINPMGEAETTASSTHKEYPAANAIDGDPDTIWHSDWTDKAAHYPYTLTIAMPRAESLRAVNFQPRQDGKNGWVKTLKVETSSDGNTWITAVAEAALANNTEWKAVTFASPVNARFVRITLLAPQDPGQSFASMAEISLTK